MNKQEFISQLQAGLSGLPECETEERLSFYSEMIDDYTEEGFTEEEAVAQIGSVSDVISQILAQTPITNLVKEKIKGNKKQKRKMKAWAIVLLVLGSPLWFSLMIAAMAVVLSVYIVIWAVVISFWAAAAAVAICAPAAVITGLIYICLGKFYPGLFMIAAGLVCAGLAIYLVCGCIKLSKGFAVLTKKITIGIKRCFIN
ncbi:MAG: DUF1700 domain-containing protein [Lachnospiraceae bacterium]|nr:DUF1700 domain-containing protein [Lachnospiraceae bacterium]